MATNSTDDYKVWVDEIGQFIRHNSCHRRFKLEYNERELAKELPFAERLFNPIDPILQQKGQKREDSWEHLLEREGFSKISLSDEDTNTENEGVDREDIQWEDFANRCEELTEGEQVFAREAPVEGDLGVFTVTGKMDFIILRWEEAQPKLRIVEAKASRKDKTYHRIQTATYKLLVEQKLSSDPIYIDGCEIDENSVEGVVGRIDEETNRIQNVLQMDSFSFNEEESDVRKLTAEDGRLARILETDLENVDYHLNSKCDSCVFDVHCYPESARQNKLEVLGINPSEIRVLNNVGINNVDDLAEIDLDSDAVHEARQQQVFTSEFQTLKERAQARRQNLPGDSLDNEFPVTPYTHDGNSQLPEHKINGNRLVRVYLNVDYDYTEDRVVGLAAHVTNSSGEIATRFIETEDGWEPDPEVKENGPNGYRKVQGENVVSYRSNQWSGNYQSDTGKEEDIISSFFTELIGKIASVTEGSEAPIHFYVWSESEMENLVEACSRSGAGTLSQLRALLGCREPTEQLIYSVLRDEVDSRYGLGWTGRGLVVATSLPWFGDRFHWVRKTEAGTRIKIDNKFRENLFDFKTDLNIDSNNEWIQSSDPEGEAHKFEIRSRFFDSLPIPYYHAEWNTLPDPDEAEDPRVANSLRRYEESAGIGNLKAYMNTRVQALRWIDEKISFYNENINKDVIDLESLRNYSLGVEGAAEAALDFMLLEHHTQLQDYLSRCVKPPTHRVPDGKTIPISDVVCGPDGNLRAKIDLTGHDIDLETLRDRCSIDNESFVRVSPCSSDQQNGQTIPQLLKAGRTCSVENIDWKRGKVELEVIPNWGRKDNAPDYRLNSYNVEPNSDLFERATIEDSVSGFVKNRVHRKLIDSRGNHVHQWFDPEDPEIPSFSLDSTDSNENIAKIEELLNSFSIGDDDTLHPSQIDCIVEGLETRTHLIHGPPGTGKTTTIALSALSRTIQDLEQNDVVYLGANTHTAVENLIQRISEYKEEFVQLSEQHDLNLPNIELLRIDRGDCLVPEGVEGVSPKGCVREVDDKREDSIVFIAGTINQLLKIDDTLSSSATFGGDEREFYSPLLIVDEASMMVFPHFLAISELVERDGRIILSGDHKQLPPIVSHDWEEEDRPPIEKYQPFNSAFEAVRNLRSDINVDSNAVMMSPLGQSFRLPPSITNLINRIYGEQDEVDLSARDTSEYQAEPPTIDEISDLNQLWDSSTGLFLLVHDEDESRQCNPTESEIVSKLLKQSNNLAKDSVAVITPHRAQRAQLRRKLEKDSIEDSIRVIDTVEKMQGGECENIVVSATASDPSAIVENEDFLLDLNRANVAFSRAESRLFVICSRELIDHIPPEIEDYKSSVLWKTLRKMCNQHRGSVTVDGADVKIRGVDREETGPTM